MIQVSPFISSRQRPVEGTVPLKRPVEGTVPLKGTADRPVEGTERGQTTHRAQSSGRQNMHNMKWYLEEKVKIALAAACCHGGHVWLALGEPASVLRVDV